jgi:hypothetical protein
MTDGEAVGQPDAPEPEPEVLWIYGYHGIVFGAAL